MNVLIVEDEKLAADHLRNLLKKYDPDINILSRLDTVKKTVAWFESNPHPDLAFFDIQLADGLSFDVFEKTEVRCPLIFTTAFNEYTLKAFKVNSVDYLLKPIDFQELEFAINKFKKSHQNQADPSYMELIDRMKSMLTEGYKQRFVIKVGEHIKSVAVSNILYFYSLEKATYVCTDDNHHYAIDYSLDQLENLLDPAVFFKINRKYLVGLNAFQDIVSWSNSRLKLELKYNTEMDAIVAREKVAKFKGWLDR